MSNISLRDYQQRALNEALSYIHNPEDKSRALMIAPTGAGKSIYIASIANAVDFPIIVLQPSKELLEQNYAKYISYGNEASIYSASLNKKDIGHVTFATIGSIKKEVDIMRAIGVGLVLIDEAHLQTKFKSQTGEFIKALKVKKVIGFTATPIELRNGLNGSYLKMIDKSGFNMFNKIIHVTQVKEIVSNNYWAKIKYETHNVDTSDLRLNSTGAEYTEDSLSAFVNSNKLRFKIVDKVEELRSSGRKSILVFMPSIAEAEILSDSIERSVCITSGTPKKDRDKIVQSFKSQEVDVVINVNILSIGFDHPGLDAIILARPTNSFTIYYQQIGRGVRPHPSKEDVLVVDYSTNVTRFGGIETIEFVETEGKWNMLCGKKVLTEPQVPYYKTPYTSSDTTIWFGKHKGMNIKDVPLSYLKWIYENFENDSLKMDKLLTEIGKLLKLKK